MILVTGGTGFVGGHLLEKLSAAGEPARCLLRRTTKPRRLPPGVEPAFGDLASGDGVEESLRGTDTVIHLAGTTKALAPEDYYRGNVRATECLAAALQGRDIRLVHVSSVAAVGPSTESEPVDENTPPHPFTHYGKSKLEGERVARRLAPGCVIVRPPIVYGPRDTSLFQLLKSVARGIVLEISGEDRWYSAIYVDDLVDGLLTAARCAKASGRDYFLAHSQPFSWHELSATAARIAGKDPKVLRVPVSMANAVGYCAELWSRMTRNPGIISREKVAEACYSWTCNGQRAAFELGFVAPTPLATGLARTLAWYKEAGWLNY